MRGQLRLFNGLKNDKMKIKIAILLLALGMTSAVWADTKTDSLLHLLDQTILEHETFMHRKEVRIGQLKESLQQHNTTPEDQYDRNMQLYKEYKAYISDSAIYYLNQNIAIARQLRDTQREDECRLSLSYLLSSSGLYKEASDALESVRRSTLADRLLMEYYACYDNLYSELCFFTQDKVSATRYRDIANAYKDSICRITLPDSEEYLRREEAGLRNGGKYNEALKINDQRLSRAQFGSSDYALVAFHRSEIYRLAGQPEEEKCYLALSAISDIRSVIKDHASLWTLAQILYREGDVERAYRYIRFSWSETQFFNARLRSWQSADILWLIDKTYQAMIEKQNDKLQQSLFSITALALLLVIALVYIYRQMKRIAEAKNCLQEANAQLHTLNGELHQMNECLQSTNMELLESNQIKEEYIGRFIKLCSTYIDKLDAYRRMVNKKVSSGQTAELIKITRSPEALDAEVAELYVNFDTAFLHLFPDFVKKFNALLLDDEQIVLKKGELLNTELRIFALIRLGIDDSSQIAEFLRYSVNTIYNYRAKVKNKARVLRDDFEDLVRNIR